MTMCDSIGLVVVLALGCTFAWLNEALRSEAIRKKVSKREVIVYDYVDDCVPVLSAMYSKRVRGYEAAGYVIRADAL